MNAPLFAAALALVATATGAGDRPAAVGRVASGVAAFAPAGPAGLLPRFALFGWVSPPQAVASLARYEELADAGFNVTVLAWQDSGRVEDNLARLEWTRARGVRNLLFDRTLEQFSIADSSTWSAIDTVAARYAGDPAFLGYYLGDEPQESEFAIIAQYFARLRTRDPGHISWNNLRGVSAFASRAEFQAYLEAYVGAVHPAVLCDDQYDFLRSGDAHQLVENIATLAGVARAHGVPFWGIVLLVEHGVFRTVTSGMLRWQIAQWLSYGARGIGYFTYWTPAPDPLFDWQPAMITFDGMRTARYDTVRALNARLGPLGNELAGLTWLATSYAGSVPVGGTPFAADSLLARVEGRATLGFFADSTGAPCVFVANADSLAARAIVLSLAGGRGAWRWNDAGGWRVQEVGAGGRVELALEAGDFALLKFSGSVDSLATGAFGPGLVVAPNPARGIVRFALSGFHGRATLELLDLAGRRVWARDVGAGETGIAWSGERDQGGRAQAGVYFARLEDERGVTVRRVGWLGAP